MAREGKLAMDSRNESQRGKKRGDTDDDGTGTTVEARHGAGAVLDLHSCNLEHLIARMEEREKHRDNIQMQKSVLPPFQPLSADRCMFISSWTSHHLKLAFLPALTENLVHSTALPPSIPCAPPLCDAPTTLVLMMRSMFEMTSMHNVSSDIGWRNGSRRWSASWRRSWSPCWPLSHICFWTSSKNSGKRSEHVRIVPMPCSEYRR
jgi:hypothetical protein